MALKKVTYNRSSPLTTVATSPRSRDQKWGARPPALVHRVIGCVFAQTGVSSAVLEHRKQIDDLKKFKNDFRVRAQAAPPFRTVSSLSLLVPD